MAYLLKSKHAKGTRMSALYFLKIVYKFVNKYDT